jgi:ribosome-associated protein
LVSSPFPLQGPHITLAHAVKVAGLADTGGQAKIMVRQGLINVNSQPEIRPGRKLGIDDRFGTAEQEWILVPATDAVDTFE